MKMYQLKAMVKYCRKLNFKAEKPKIVFLEVVACFGLYELKQRI